MSRNSFIYIERERARVAFNYTFAPRRTGRTLSRKPEGPPLLFLTPTRSESHYRRYKAADPCEFRLTGGGGGGSSGRAHDRGIAS